MLANRWLNWWCCLHWSNCLTALSSHKLLTQNTDLSVVLHSESVSCFRKGWIINGWHQQELRHWLQENWDACVLRLSSCSMSAEVTFAMSLSDASLCGLFLTFCAAWTISNLMQNQISWVLALRKKFHAVYHGLKCFGETKLASLHPQQRQLTVALFYLLVFNTKKVKM